MKVPPEVEGEVRIVVHRYFAAIDTSDWDLLASCFAEDAQFIVAGQTPDDAPHLVLEGPGGIATGISEAARFEMSTHLLANMVARLDGDIVLTTVHGVAHFVQADAGGKTSVVTRGIRYEDQFALGTDGWLIRRRLHRALWQFSAPAMNASPLPDDHGSD